MNKSSRTMDFANFLQQIELAFRSARNLEIFETLWEHLAAGGAIIAGIMALDSRKVLIEVSIIGDKTGRIRLWLAYVICCLLFSDILSSFFLFFSFFLSTSKRRHCYHLLFENDCLCILNYREFSRSLTNLK